MSISTSGNPILNPPDEPAFAEPWQAQIFAVAVKLHEKGVFTWKEWSEALGREISASPTRTYYENWLAALEALLNEKNVITHPERLRRINAWDRAARATPHGQPIELSRGAEGLETSPGARKQNLGEPR